MRPRVRVPRVNELAWNASVWLDRCRNSARYIVSLPVTYRNWWAVPLQKLGRDVLLELRDGTRYFVRGGTTDLAAVNEAVILNPYLKCPQIRLAENATVIDVGANIGDFTMRVARRCPRGRILAVEPVATNVQMIDRQISLNRVSNVQTVTAAIGAAPVNATMCVAGLGTRTTASGGEGEPVAMMTLEQLMAGYAIETVDLLKLDCEGAEWDILPAAERVLPRIRQISMEFHCERGWTPAKLADWLRQRGFEVWHTGGEWNGLLWATRRRGANTDRR